MQLRSFSQYLTEERKEIYFVFGRFNPPTIGHEKLFDTLKKKAGKANFRIYASQSQDPKKNPLSFKDKIKFLRKMFPKYARNVMADNNVRTALDIAVKLYEQGYTRIVMVAGSDRIKEFDTLLKKYNDVKSRHGYYNFEDGINVISAGERDPDAEGVTGMSASKVRAAAADGDLDLFMKGVNVEPKLANLLYKAVRKGMGLKEVTFKDVKLESVSQQREDYVKGNLFNKGDTVRVKDLDQTGVISKLGTNFVVVEMGQWKKRVWLEDIELVNEYQELGTKKLLDTYRKMTPGQSEAAQDPDIKDKKGTQPKAYYAKDAKGKEMSKSTKSKRDAHFNKQAKKADDDPNAYKPAPGDANAKTKPSKHTKKFKQMFGEKTLSFEDFNVTEGKADAALKKKADKSGMPLGILRQVFNRGVAAWKGGHRPGTNSIQWGLARVNSFVTKSKGTWGGADKDLAAKVRGS